MEENFENCKKEFEDYVRNFDMTNDKIKRKHDHSLRVVEYAEQIAISENLNEHDLFLAKVCALLHDIARFQQAKEFDTFNDLISFDHGDMGYKILSDNNYIENYLQNEEDIRICLKTIKNHNKYQVEEGLSEKELYFTKIVRDSDKLDLLNRMKNEVKDQRRDIHTEIVEAIHQHVLYHIHDDEADLTDVSLIGMQLCFVFDLNLKRSFQIIQDQKIIERKINLLRDNCSKEVIDEIEKSINDYIKSRM